MDFLLLKVAKLRWYIRYTVAVCTLYASWWMFKESTYAIPFIFFVFAMIMIKEISPSLLLIAASIWLWPTGFFDTPFAYMTFGIIFQFAGAIALFSLGIFMGVKMYTDYQYAMYVKEKSATPPVSPEAKRRQELGYDK